MAGITEPFKASLYTIASQFIAILVSMYLMYKVMGRRSMMLVGSALAAIVQLVTAIIFTAQPDKPGTWKAVVGLTIVYCVCYMGFSGTVSWPLSAEIVSSRLRVVTFSFATGLNYFAACELSCRVKRREGDYRV